MSSRRVLALLAVVLGCGSLAQAQKVSVDYDHNANFETYKTYAWIKSSQPAKNPLMAQRIVEDIDAELAKKGLQKVEQSNDPDMVVFYQAEVTTQYSLDTYGMGGWRWGMGGMAQTDINKIPVGGLAVTMGDAKKKAVIWRSTATGEVSDNPEKVSKSIQKAVEKMFKKFPPKAKG
jgi:hypothetical protein